MSQSSVRYHGRSEADPVEAFEPVLSEGRITATHHAGQWGLAALLLSCFLLVMFPVLLIAVFLGAVVGVMSLTTDEQSLRVYAAYFNNALYGFAGAAVLALIFGIIGVMSAVFRRQPAGLAIAGSIVSVLALVTQLLLLLMVHRVVDDMIRDKPLWQQQIGPPGFKQGQWPHW